MGSCPSLAKCECGCGSVCILKLSAGTRQEPCTCCSGCTLFEFVASVLSGSHSSWLRMCEILEIEYLQMLTICKIPPCSINASYRPIFLR